jgi:predicted membrane-bound spermidine synthase
VNKFRIRFSRLELIAFVTGFVLMVFELAGARILAPTIGSSTYIWTSVIGVIIAALSLGYWAGGKLADSRGYMIDVARLMLLAGVTSAATLLFYEGTLGWVAEVFEDSRIQGVAASLLLFTPTSFILGMISPYLAKLNVRSLKTTGRSIASLSALNSVGGIVGTFTAGFVLFGYTGSRETLAIVAVVMIMLSWTIAPKIEWKPRVFVSLATVLLLATPFVPRAGAISIDTASAHYEVVDAGSIRYLTTGPNAAQSGVSLQQPDRLLFWYTQQMAYVTKQATRHDDILILGGGAFTLPEYLAREYPDATIDVVEIDPELAGIAREYFDYSDPENVNLIFEDARTFVNQTTKQYDVVLVDVYGDAQVPFSFMTREFGEQLARATKQDGVVAANMIAGLVGDCKILFDALSAPYMEQFGSGSFRIDKPDETKSNIVAVYAREAFEWSAAMPLDSPPVLYTDNFAPAERLQQDCRQT